MILKMKCVCVKKRFLLFWPDFSNGELLRSLPNAKCVSYGVSNVAGQF